MSFTRGNAVNREDHRINVGLRGLQAAQDDQQSYTRRRPRPRIFDRWVEVETVSGSARRKQGDLSVIRGGRDVLPPRWNKAEFT